MAEKKVECLLDTKALRESDNLPNDAKESNGALEGKTGRKPIKTLREVICLADFEQAADERLLKPAWAYYASGATDEITLKMNKEVYSKVLFRPRALVDVSTVSTETSILGFKSSQPFFICPAGQGGLAHQDGEKLLAKAAGEFGIIEFISSYASHTPEDIINSASAQDQTFFFQSNLHRDEALTESILQKVVKAGVKAIAVTVDAPTYGKRETDLRQRLDFEASSKLGLLANTPEPSQTLFDWWRDAALNWGNPATTWKDLEWVRQKTGLPIILKGINSVEDAKKAIEYGVDAIYLSNHGGRNFDGSPPCLLTLLELRRDVPELFSRHQKKKMPEIYIDGGFRRGADIVKALALGARAVGLGRPFLYSLVFGPDGPKMAFKILQDEIESALRLLGVAKLEDLNPNYVNTKQLDSLLGDPWRSYD